MQSGALWAVLFWTLGVSGGHCAKVIHVFVALADNAHQGIIPVPAKIGDGDKPDDNLYWGCDEGVRSWFAHSRRWKKIGTPKAAQSAVLERIVFKHVKEDAFLVADAWRGSEIKACTLAFALAAAGQGSEEVTVGSHVLKAGGAADLVAYIGHDGLMDFRMDWPSPTKGSSVKPAMVLCCISRDYFGPPLVAAGARPVLLTTQLMYPGAFVLHDALEAWLGGQDTAAIRNAAGRAYAKNQGISLKAALGVFAEIPGP